MQNRHDTLLFGAAIQERYIVRTLLGKGRFGAVYLVRDLSLKRDIPSFYVLKKVINPSKQERDQITSEAMLLRRLRHESLPRVYKVFHDDKHDRVYILTDYIEGPNLAIMRLRQAQERFSLPDIITVMAPVVEAVSYLHSQRPPILHQNITPTNVILPPGFAKPVLVDFGIARPSHLVSTNEAVRRCSPGYGALEQYSGKISTRTDIYGLAAYRREQSGSQTSRSIRTGVLDGRGRGDGREGGGRPKRGDGGRRTWKDATIPTLGPG